MSNEIYPRLNVTLNGIAGLDVPIIGSSQFYVPRVEDDDLIFEISGATPISPINVGNVRGSIGPIGLTGPQGPIGEGFNILGLFPTLQELLDTVTGQKIGDAYLIGIAEENIAYVWDGADWVNIGTIKGDAATIQVGTTTTLTPGSSTTVINSGTIGDAVFDFGIPEGKKGDKGDKGDAATIEIDETTTLSPGSSATVTNSGTPGAAIFNFGIPSGIQGLKGDQGNAATITVGEVTTGAPGTTVEITNVGNSHAALFDFRIPQGQTGEGLKILGHFDTFEDLEIAHPIGNSGDMYTVGTVVPYDLFIWSVEISFWINIGAFGGGGGHTILDEEAIELPQRLNLQFEGSDIIDDEMNERTIVRARPAPGEGHILQNDFGANMPQRAHLQFAGISTIDNIENDRTVVQGLVAGSGTSFRTNVILYHDQWLPVDTNLYPKHEGKFYQNWENPNIVDVTNGVFKLDFSLELQGINPPDDAITTEGKIIFFIRDIPDINIYGTVILTNTIEDLEPVDPSVIAAIEAEIAQVSERVELSIITANAAQTDITATNALLTPTAAGQALMATERDGKLEALFQAIQADAVKYGNNALVDVGNVGAALDVLLGPPVILSAVLLADGWDASGEQVIYNVEIPEPNDTTGDISLPVTATDDQFRAWAGAMPRVTGQSLGAVTIRAIGNIPNIDIPIEIEVRQWAG